MDKDDASTGLSAEQAMLNLESTLKTFHENISKETTSKPNYLNMENIDAKLGDEDIITVADDADDDDQNKGYVSDFFVESDSKSSATEDIQKNPREALNQFNIKPAGSEQMVLPVPGHKRPSAEEITKNWEDLGVQRCQNCNFTTDSKELFKNHYTTCTTIKSTGIIKLSYGANGEFKCNVCDDSVWTNKAEFEEHIVCHLQESPYVCLTCQNKKFASRQLIEIHTKSVHPNGDARCGLKGMKNGRKYSEELMRLGTMNIQGKLSIPKTPRNVINIMNSPKEGEATAVAATVAVTTLPAACSSIATPSVSQHIQVASVQHQLMTPLLSQVSPASSVPTHIIHHRPAVSNIPSPTQKSTENYLHIPGTKNIIPPIPSATNISHILASMLTSTSVLSAALQTTSQIAASSKHGMLVVSSTAGSSESRTDRAMPPARTTMNYTMDPSQHLYTSKGGTLVKISPGEQAKSKHLDSLFGELNTRTNEMQPTTVSQKIKDIANPSAGKPIVQQDPNRTGKESVSKPIQYHLKTITEYTCTPSVQTISPSISTMPQQSLILVPVGQPIMQSHPQIMPTGGILYQAAGSGNVLVPFRPGPGSTTATHSNFGSKQTTIPQQMQVVNRIPQNTVMLTAGAQQPSNSQHNNAGSSSLANLQYLTQTVGSITAVSETSSSTIVPPVQPASLIQMKPPPSYRETVNTNMTCDIRPQLTATVEAMELPIQHVDETLDDNTKNAKKFLFRIKPGQGFVCEACKKFTRDEFVFRRHVWGHFHGFPLACKTCTHDFIANKAIVECKLVGNIVCNLIKRSSNELAVSAAKPFNVMKVGGNEVIDITDEDDDTNQSSRRSTEDPATEVIVLDDEDGESGDGPGLQILISSTFSLSDTEKLEQMHKTYGDGVMNEWEDKMDSQCTQHAEVTQYAPVATPEQRVNVEVEKSRVPGAPNNDTVKDNLFKTDFEELKTSDPRSDQVHIRQYIDQSDGRKNARDTKDDTSINDKAKENLFQKDVEKMEVSNPHSDEVRGQDFEQNDGRKNASNKVDEPSTSDLAKEDLFEKDVEEMEISNPSGCAVYQQYLEKNGSGKNASDAVNEQLGEEGEEDDDGKVKDKHLLDKSLSEPGNDSSEIVSQVLETNLKDYDPSTKPVEDKCYMKAVYKNVPKDMDIANIDVDLTGEISTADVDKNKEHSNSSRVVAFESEILSKQSYNSFYVCGYEGCSYTCMSSSKYREHLQSKQHEREYNYTCGHCGQKDYTEDMHVRHLFSHANSKIFLLYKCPIRLCKYKTNLLHLYSAHLKAHRSEEITIKCTYCHKTFRTIDSLEQHLKQNLLKFVLCPHCSFKFVSKYVVMMHIRLCHPDRLRMVSVTSHVVCNEREINFYVAPKTKKYTDILEKDIPDAEQLDIPALLDDFQKDHVTKEKTAQEQSKMEKCSENGDNEDVLSLPEEDQSEFKEKERQKKDIPKEINRRPSKGKGKSDIIAKGGPKSLECPQCSYLSYNQSLHAKHVSLHDTEPDREKRFVCNLCPKGTNFFPEFKKHLGNHIGKHVFNVFSCTTCAYWSNQKCHIMDHVQDAHAEETLYTIKENIVENHHSECRYCAFKARSSEQVAAHEAIVHRVDPIGSLKKPEEDIHESIKEKTEHLKKPSSGAENEYGTAGNDSETHRRKKKYHCEYCNEFFKHKMNLKEHLTNEHNDIENKQFIFFKCKYCAYTSTMKDKIIGHLGKEHSGQELRILRKVEHVESNQSKSTKVRTCTDKSEVNVKGASEEDNEMKIENTETINKKEIVIPDGNVFKQSFICPKCPFTSNMRITTMKHLKEHPELKPIRPDQRKVSKKTARKSSTSVSLFVKMDISKKKSTLIQEIPKSTGRLLQNPFTVVKESVVKDSDHIETSMSSDSPSKDPFILGEQRLHATLSACFIPLEKELKFQCRMCKQKMFKKFVLHRHILDHLKILFFRCRYCDEGSIERTLMVGHIQKDHSSKPILYYSVAKSDLEQQFKERIFNQDFNDTVDLFAASGTQENAVDQVKNSGIVKKAVHEYQTIDDDSEGENEGTEEPIKYNASTDSSNSLKCPKCRYVGRYKHILNLHIDSHNDPAKVFTCSVCDYRGDKFAVLKHVYSVFHLTQAKVLQNGKPVYENQVRQSESNKDDSKLTSVCDKSEREDNQSSIGSTDSYVTTLQGKQIKVDSITISQSGVFEMKTAYKCKVCGEKRDSKSAMYHHFRVSKCNKPVVKCSLCSFQNTVKAAIYRHAEKRHPGKKITITDLPMAAKFKTVKFPIRQDKSIINTLNITKKIEHVQESNNVSKRSESSQGSQSKSLGNDFPDNGQIRCQLCAKYVCESIMKLQFHVNTAHSGVLLHCQKCSYKTPLVKHMINHCKNLHLQKNALYGNEPSRSSKKPENTATVKLEKMIKTVTSIDSKIVFKCPKCDLELSSLGSVQTHLYVHYNYKPYCCKYCGKNISRLDQIRKHMENVHEGRALKYEHKIDEAIESKVQKIFGSVKRNVLKQKVMLGQTRPSSLDRMELVEEGIRRNGKMFHCDLCTYKSARKSTVKSHVASIHAGLSKKRPLEIDSDTEYPAKKIDKKDTAEDSDIASSTSSETNEDESDNINEESAALKYKVTKSPNGVKKYKCSRCEYVNENVKNLKLHVWRNHGSTMSGKREEPTYKCYYCSYSSVYTTYDIYRHYRAHHDSLTVVKYTNKFGELMYRDRKVGSKDVRKPSKSSPTRSLSESSCSDYAPVKPVKRNITGVTNYSCHLCEYSGPGFFHFRLHLIAHKEMTQITTELDDESKLSCGFCGYIGKSTFDLSIHIASHMAQMRYKCPYCDFKQFHSVKVHVHLKNVHSDREEIVIDRELRKTDVGNIKLVNLCPELEVKRVRRIYSRTMKYKRIMIETDESSNGSSADNEDTYLKFSSEREEMDESDNNNIGVHTERLTVTSDTSGPLDKSIPERNITNVFQNNEETISSDNIKRTSNVPTEKSVSETENESIETKNVENRNQTTEFVATDFGSKKESNDSQSDQIATTENETQMFSIETQPFSPSDVDGMFQKDNVQLEGEMLEESTSYNESTESKNSANLENVNFNLAVYKNVEEREVKTCQENMTCNLNFEIQSDIETDKNVKQPENETNLNLDKDWEVHSDVETAKGIKCCENETEDNLNHDESNTIKQTAGDNLEEAQIHAEEDIEEHINPDKSEELTDSFGVNVERKAREMATEKENNTNIAQELTVKCPVVGSSLTSNDNVVFLSDASNEANRIHDVDSEILDKSCMAYINERCNSSDIHADTEPNLDADQDSMDTFEDELENACTSTNINLDVIDTLEMTHIEGSKSPRNVFDSISDVKLSKEDQSIKDEGSMTEMNESLEKKINEKETHEADTEDMNVFEKFSSEIERRDTDDANEAENEEGSAFEKEVQENIFEKFQSESTKQKGESNDVATILESGTDACQAEDSDKNIFETFSGVESEKMDEKLGNGNQETENGSNAFSMVSFHDSEKTHADGFTQGKIETCISDQKDGNIFNKFANGQSATTSNIEPTIKNEGENDSNIFSKFSIGIPVNKEKVEEYSDVSDNEDCDQNLFEKFSVETATSASHKNENINTRLCEENVDEPTNSIVLKSGGQTLSGNETSDVEHLINKEIVEQYTYENDGGDKNLFEQFSFETASSSGAHINENTNTGQCEEHMDEPTNNIVLKSGDITFPGNENKDVEDMEVDELIHSIEQTVNDRILERISDSHNDDHDMETE